MNKRSLAGRLGVLTAAALLAALAGCLMRTSAPVPVAAGVLTAPPTEEPEEQEKSLVEVFGLGVRPASLLSNTGFAADELPYLRHWRESVGVAPEDVEAFAVVYFEGDAARVLLVRTKTDVPQGNVMMACEAGNLTKMGCGAKVFTGESGLAVHFPQRDVAMIADSVETMSQCLTRVPDLMKRLDDAGKHDVTAWHDKPVEEAFGARDADELHAALKMQKLRLWSDVALTFDASVELEFADDQSARRGEAILAGCAEFGGGGLGMGIGSLRILKALPEVMRTGKEKDEALAELIGLVPLDLLARSEKALRKGRVEVKGKTASLTFRVPLKLEDRPACTKLFAHPLARCVDERVSPGMVFARSLFTTARRRQRAIAEAPGEPGAPLPEPPPDLAGAPVNGAPRTVTLTVANVRKEDLVVFQMDDKGELTLPQKVPAGDAIDLDVVKGQRLVAVFLSDPYRETYPASANHATWLIRPVPKAVPTTVRSMKPPK
jgi:hypothetical protein